MDAAPLSEYGFAVDYEVELGVVIGKTAKNVRAEDGLDHIFGYTVINDVGVALRAVPQQAGRPRQELRHLLPDGPVHRHPGRAARLGRTSGSSRSSMASCARTRSSASRSDRRRVAIEWISSIITHRPGDASRRHARRVRDVHEPAVFLQPGDTVTVSASGIGELTNPVVAGTARTHPR